MGLHGLLEPVHFGEYSDPDMSWGLENKKNPLRIGDSQDQSLLVGRW